MVVDAVAGYWQICSALRPCPISFSPASRSRSRILLSAPSWLRLADRRRSRIGAAAGGLLLWPDHPDMGGAIGVCILASGLIGLVDLTERGVARNWGCCL